MDTKSVNVFAIDIANEILENDVLGIGVSGNVESISPFNGIAFSGMLTPPSYFCENCGSNERESLNIDENLSIVIGKVFED
ncbi:MAG: hypothetical protein FWF57_00635 [Defluviitaleaceae bacterium]|nr:hypothetical protein [Defluviitaleaceae bacterium]